MDFHGFSNFSWIFLDFHRFVMMFFPCHFLCHGKKGCGSSAFVWRCCVTAWTPSPLMAGSPNWNFCHRSHLPWANWFPNIVWEFSHRSLGVSWSIFSNGLVKNHQLVFQKPPKPVWGERDLLSTADETLLSAEVGIIVIQLYMRTTPRTQDSSPQQDYEPFLGAGIPTETFMGDCYTGCGVGQSHTVLLHIFDA